MNIPANVLESIKEILKNLPTEWLKLTTHRLDIYNESEAKFEFLQALKDLVSNGQADMASLNQLPTAYDYIRLGHQLSSLLEWVLAEVNGVPESQVIAFASKTMPILAFLRTQAIIGQNTVVYYDGETSPLLDQDRLRDIYGYEYQTVQVGSLDDVPESNGMTLFVTEKPWNESLTSNQAVDAVINVHADYGAYVVLLDETHVAAVQHVRRRESIAMSPQHCLQALQSISGETNKGIELQKHAEATVAEHIQLNTGSQSKPLVASSGLSIQYAILMGLVEAAKTEHPDKDIKIILPPNCYGGTNDQSRRVAELIPQVGILDLLVDGGADLVGSLETVLTEVAKTDAVPIVLAEIPTNPRVEVPDMRLLGETLAKQRQTNSGEVAVLPTFMVDQTFCPHVKLLHDESELAQVKTISFSSGSKFPSGGRCIAGYCAANEVASDLMKLIEAHLLLSDNAADANQLNILAETMPSMPERIEQAYVKTRDFVDRIQALLPESKMFFVNDEIAEQGFTPSVFSLDLPVQAETAEARTAAQKELNKQLIQFMIERHPDTCKNCVSYGQLKGSYWTIPATSTQGTTKEADKDYVVRVSLAPDVDVDELMGSFEVFCQNRGLV